MKRLRAYCTQRHAEAVRLGLDEGLSTVVVGEEWRRRVVG